MRAGLWSAAILGLALSRTVSAGETLVATVAVDAVSVADARAVVHVDSGDFQTWSVGDTVLDGTMRVAAVRASHVVLVPVEPVKVSGDDEGEVRPAPREVRVFLADEQGGSRVQTIEARPPGRELGTTREVRVLGGESPPRIETPTAADGTATAAKAPTREENGARD